MKDEFKNHIYSTSEDILNQITIIMIVPLIFFILIANYLWTLEETNILIRIIVNSLVISIFFFVYLYLKYRLINDSRNKYLKEINQTTGIKITKKDLKNNQDDIKKLLSNINLEINLQKKIDESFEIKIIKCKICKTDNPINEMRCLFCGSLLNLFKIKKEENYEFKESE